MKSRRPLRFWVLPLALSAVYTANAAPRQVPTVLLDGQPLALGDARATVSGGRVLVPMRAIFEALEADVEWDPESTIITARTVDNRIISLQPGVKSAAINGRLAVLDQPPVITGGRVLVPLRFVSEALGARVQWDPQRFTVAVNRTAALQITSLQVSGPQLTGPLALRAGQVVEVTVRGTAGARGTWRLVPGPTDLPLTEVAGQPGLYRGSYTVREGDDLPVTQALARLEKSGQQTERMSDARLTLDTTTPRLRQQILQTLGPDDFEAVVVVDENSDAESWRMLAGYWAEGTFPTSDADFTPGEAPLQTTVENNRIHVRITRPETGSAPARLAVEDAAGNRAQIAFVLPPPPLQVEPQPQLDVNQRFIDENEALELQLRDRSGVEAWADVIDPLTQAVVGTIPLQLGEDGRFFGTLPLGRWQLPTGSRVRFRSRDHLGIIHSEIYPLDLPPGWPNRPGRTGDRELYLEDVRAYGDEYLSEGETLRVEARGTPDARATVNLGAGVGDFRLSETGRGVYSGTYTVRRGDNARNIRPEVRLERGNRQTERRIYKSFNFDTEAPKLRSTSIRRDAELNAIPDRINFEYDGGRREELDRATATLTTERGRFTLTTRIDGNKVEVRLDPSKINAEGRMAIEVRARDEAGNESRDTLEFRVRAGASALRIEFDANRRVPSGEDVLITVQVQNWQRGTVAVGLMDNAGRVVLPLTPLQGRNGTFSGRIKAPVVNRQQDLSVVARLSDGNTVIATVTADRKLVVVPAAASPLSLEILNISPNNGQAVRAGDNVAVRIRATSGARVTWSLGRLLREQVLTEYPAGTGNFEARYTLRATDGPGDLPIRVRAETQGTNVTREATLRVVTGGNPGNPGNGGNPGQDTQGPSIRLLSPTDGASLNDAPAELILEVTDPNRVQSLEAELVRNGAAVPLIVQAEGTRVRLPIGKRLQDDLRGDIILRVRARDVLGNQSRQNFRFFVRGQAQQPQQPQQPQGPQQPPGTQQPQEPRRPTVRISSPRRRGEFSLPVSVRGEANPGVDVEVQILAVGGPQGRLRDNARFTVKADNQGQWQTPAWSPRAMDNDTSMQVNIQAAVRANGREATDDASFRTR